MKKKKKIILISVCLTLVLIIWGGVIMSGILLFRMPASYIEHKLSKEIPLGSSIQEVQEIILQHEEWDSNKLGEKFRVYSHGTIYGSDGKVVRNYGGQLESGEYYVGTQQIKVHMGHSWFWFTDIYFAFDENDKLIDIAVYKEFAIE